MKLGILQTGTVNETLVDQFGEYPEMFEALYQSVDPAIEVVTYAVVDNVLPDAPNACDAWLITGSKFGVYDDEPWIDPLKEFLREARAARVPMIGICFGHQIMAEAFGGKAVKSEKGWGCGVHAYSFVQKPGWLSPDLDGFSMHAMHQDQVTEIPSDATRLATSQFCQNAMLSYGDPEFPDAISVQPHPEFQADYAKALVALRAGDLIPEERATPALESFGSHVHNQDFVRWSLDFVRTALERQKAA